MSRIRRLQRSWRRWQARIESAAEPFFRGVLRHRIAILAGAAVLTVGFASQLPKLRMDPDTEAYVPKHHPIRVFWQEAKDRFGIGRELLVAIENSGPHGVFTPASLRALAELTEGIEAIDGVEPSDVRSLADSEAVIGTEEGLDFVAYFETPPATQEEAEAVRRRVEENPVVLNRLVSEDHTIAAIVVRVHHDPDRPEPTEIYRRIAEYVNNYPLEEGRVLVAGDPAIEYWFGRQMAADLMRLIPLATLTVIVILFLCFPFVRLRRLALRGVVLTLAALAWASWRGFDHVVLLEVAGAALAVTLLTVRGAFLPSLVVATAVVWTWGLQAMLDLPIYIAGTMVPPLLLAIGCADGIHIMERYFEKARSPQTRDDIVVSTMVELWRPVVLTSLTTAAGFGSLMAGSMTVYQVFGLTTAFGILVAMVLSLTVLPAALAVMPLPSRVRTRRRRALIPQALGGMAAWIERHRLAVTAAGLAIALASAAGATRLYIDYSWVESLQPDSPVLEADRVLRTRHGGTMPLNIIIRAAEPGGIKDPRLLQAMDRVASELDSHPYVGDTRSVAEYVKRLNQAMHENRADELRIPDNDELVAQYLLLFSISGDPSELDDVVDYEYSNANLAVLLRSDRMQVLNDVIARTEALLDRHVRSLGASATVSGPAVVEKTVMDMVFSSQVSSLGMASVLVLAFLILLFRSVRDAFVCMLGPAFTALVNFGVMGGFGIALGPEKAMISAIALGIGIDYSIHLLSRFRDMTAQGLDVDEAVVEAMQTTGRAILFNGLVVVAGFAVLGMSRSPSNATFGWMIAGNMAVACLASLTLLPAALAIIGHRDRLRAAACCPSLRVRLLGRLGAREPAAAASEPYERVGPTSVPKTHPS